MKNNNFMKKTKHISFILIIILLIVSWNICIRSDNTTLQIVLGIISIPLILLCVKTLMMSFSDDASLSKNNWKKAVNSYERALSDINVRNKKEQERVKDFDVLKQQNRERWNQEKNYLLSERRKVENLLSDGYNMNIIPSPYRNLTSIYYIYDYMSTSQQTLEQTLLHERMENGIQRLESKINTIIVQNEKLIFNTRKILESTEEVARNSRLMVQSMDQLADYAETLVDSNVRILESCQRNERNTQQAAQYAAMASQYAEANAYFSLATYLKY